MFDLPPTPALREEFEVETPSTDEPWRIGAIVGPSGSGKSTIARAAFGDAVYKPDDWPQGKAVIDGFGDLPIKQITRALTAVGFGSPPSWLKPHHVLSTGEKFRCELARALLRAECGVRSVESAPSIPHSAIRTPHLQPIRKPSGALQIRPTFGFSERLLVFDEFTSVVDRTVAKVASAAVAKAIRSGQLSTRLVVVSCHNDILPWLAPDWVVEMSTRKLTRHIGPRGRLRRPAIELEIVRARHAAWDIFARHHYLSGGLSRAAQVFLAIWNDRPVALCAVVALYGHVGRRRIHRLVTLPDFQGIGIGSRLLDHVAGMQSAAGKRVNLTTSHPAVIAHCRGSPSWRAVAVRRSGAAGRQCKAGIAIRGSRGRATVSFEFETPRQVIDHNPCATA